MSTNDSDYRRKSYLTVDRNSIPNSGKHSVKPLESNQPCPPPITRKQMEPPNVITKKLSYIFQFTISRTPQIGLPQFLSSNSPIIAANMLIENKHHLNSCLDTNHPQYLPLLKISIFQVLNNVFKCLPNGEMKLWPLTSLHAQGWRIVLNLPMRSLRKDNSSG